MARKNDTPMPQYQVLRPLENEHAQSFEERVHQPGAVLDAAQLRAESIPILIEWGIIAPHTPTSEE
jgi:hypothetical protein